MDRWGRPARLVVAILLVITLIALVVRRSQHSAIARLPPPPTTLALTTPTTAPNLSGVGLGAVLAGGAGPTVVEMGPGTAGLVGTVTGPQSTTSPSTSAGTSSSQPGTSSPGSRASSAPTSTPATSPPSPTGPSGPVSGATVEVDRFVGSAMTSVKVLTAANGTWSLSNILGGRYRVRAWLAPFLALTQPQDLYLPDGHRDVVNMNLDSYGGTAISSAMAPNPPVEGEPASLVVSVGVQTVGNDGVVRTTPEPGTLLNLLTGSQTSIDSADPVSANQVGQGAWTLTCLSAGPQLVQITLDGGSPHTVPVPNCVAPPPTATTTTTSVPTRSAPTTTLPTPPPRG